MPALYSHDPTDRLVQMYRVYPIDLYLSPGYFEIRRSPIKPNHP
jgi:hypothetical protein